MSKIKKYGIILTTVFTVFASSLIMTKAASPTVQVSWTKELAWDYPYSSSTRTALLYNLFINSSATCTGTITIDFSGMSANDKQYIDSGTWFSEGCRVTYNSSTHKLTVSINSQQFCTVSCLTLGHGTYTGIDLSYTISKSLTIDTDSDITTKLDDILEKFDSLENYSSAIASDVNNLYLLTVDLLGDVGDINTAMTSVLNYLGSVDDGISSLESLIVGNTTVSTHILSQLVNSTSDINYESLLAYQVFYNSNAVYYSDNVGPYILWNTGDQSNTINVPANSSVYYYFLTLNSSLGGGNFSSSNSNVSVTLNNTNVRTSPVRIQYLKITNNTSSRQDTKISITFGSSTDFKVYPLYFGDLKNLSQDMQSLLQTTSETLTTTRLNTIISILNNLPSGNDYTSSLESIITLLNTLISQGNLIDDLYTTLGNIYSSLLDMETFNSDVLIPMLQNINNSVLQSLQGHVYYESLSSYFYFPNNTLYLDGGLYPYVLLNTGDVSERISIPGNSSYYFYFLTTNESLSTSNFVSSDSNVTVSLNNNYIQSIPNRIQYLQFTNTSSERLIFSVSVSFSSSSDFKIYPLYLGNRENLSQDMQSLLGVSSETLTTQRLSEIIELLGDTVDSETTNNNILDYNTNMEIINDIENDISVDFGTHDNTFQNNESNKWQFDSQLQNPVNALQGVFTSIIGFVPVAGTWLSVLLLCAVLIALLG